MAEATESAMPSLHNRKMLAVITGASRGIGREIAIQLARTCAEGSVLILHARNIANVKKTMLDLKNVRSNISILLWCSELAKLDVAGLAAEIKGAYKSCGPFDAAMIFHNAGTVGDLSVRTTNMTDGKAVQEYFAINLSAFIMVNAEFLKATEQTETRVVINITSLLAIHGLPFFGLYASGKAAREGFLRVLHAESPGIRVLNYSPGPVETDMLEEIREKAKDPEIGQSLPVEDWNPLAPDDSIQKLMLLLERNDWLDCAHIDYFDIQ